MSLGQLFGLKADCGGLLRASSCWVHPPATSWPSKRRGSGLGIPEVEVEGKLWSLDGKWWGKNTRINEYIESILSISKAQSNLYIYIVLIWLKRIKTHGSLAGSYQFSLQARTRQVQHPLDRGGDLLFLPIRVVMEPLTSFVSALINHGGAKGVGCEDISLKVWGVKMWWWWWWRR